MNISGLETMYGRQGRRQWTPLFTQQLRLRHLQQIIFYNIKSANKAKLYFTLHLSAMCSPFYTSNVVEQGFHQKLTSLNFKTTEFSSISMFVLRIWQKNEGELDAKILSWGVNLSGLVFLGNKILDIQPESFNENTVIFQIQEGYFTSLKTLRSDLQKPLLFIDYVNIVSNEFSTNAYRHSIEKWKKNEVKNSYHLKKLLMIHSLQIDLRNKLADVQSMSGKIYANCGLCSSNLEQDQRAELFGPENNEKFVNEDSSPLLTMNSLIKMLHYQKRPTKAQMQRIFNVKKDIEVIKFRTKLLMQEKDKKSTKVRFLKQKYTNLVDENEERASYTMNNYRQLSKDYEKLKEWKVEMMRMKEALQNVAHQLNYRQKQLMAQLLEIYPINCMSLEEKYYIHNIYLPNSDNFYDCSESGLPVALGYIAHILLMCSSFLQVPLRYPITYFGSRSHILDHVTRGLAEKDRDFPLYTKGKDKMQFNYAVYLLNKNIAQLRWWCGQHTLNFQATLSNLLLFLENIDSRLWPRSFSTLVLHNENIPQSAGNDSILRKTETTTTSLISTCISNSLHDQGLAPNGSNDIKSRNNTSDNSNRDVGALLEKRSCEYLQLKPFEFVTNSRKADPIIDVLRHEYQIEKLSSSSSSASPVVIKRRTRHEGGSEGVSSSSSSRCSRNQKNPGGLGQILSVPEAYMNKQITSYAFKAYLTKQSDYSNIVSSNQLLSRDDARKSEEEKEEEEEEEIEQGMDLLNPSSSTVANLSENKISIETGKERKFSSTSLLLNSDNCLISKMMKQSRRKSRSVGSFTPEEDEEEGKRGHQLLLLRETGRLCFEVGSDPLINISSSKNREDDDDDDENVKINKEEILGISLDDVENNSQKMFLQKWLKNGSLLLAGSSDENFFPDDLISDNSKSSSVSPKNNNDALSTTTLDQRTSALLSKTSFNLVKPK